jgi:hypothetical protein
MIQRRQIGAAGMKGNGRRPGGAGRFSPYGGIPARVGDPPVLRGDPRQERVQLSEG